MAYGVEVYNALGEKILGVDDRCPRIHGTVTIPAVGPRGTTTVAVAGMTTDGTWFVDTFSNVANLTWAVAAGGIAVRNESYYSASTSFTVTIFRG